MLRQTGLCPSGRLHRNGSAPTTPTLIFSGLVSAKYLSVIPRMGSLGAISTFAKKELAEALETLMDLLKSRRHALCDTREVDCIMVY